MQITKNWRIEADNLNIVLLERQEHKDGLDTFEPEGYFPDVGSALKFLVDAEVRGTGLRDLTSVCCKISGLHQLIEKLAISQWTYRDLSPENASSDVVGADTEVNPPKDTSDPLTGAPDEPGKQLEPDGQGVLL